MLLDKNEPAKTTASFKSPSEIDIVEIDEFATWSEKIDEAIEKSKNSPTALDALKPILSIFSQMKTEMEFLHSLNNEYLNKDKTPEFWTLSHTYREAYNEKASQLKIELLKAAIEKVKDEKDKKSLWQKAEEINKKTKHVLGANREYIMLALEIIAKFIPK